MRFQQPQAAPRIDWANPLSRDITFAFEAPAGQRNLVNAIMGETRGAGVSRASGIYGAQYNFSGGQANRSCSFGVDHGLDGATQATWDILVYFSGANPGSHFFGQWDANLQWLIQGNGGGGLVWVAADDNAGNRRRWDINSGVFTSAGWYRIIASWQGGASAFVLVNGLSRSLDAVNTAANSIGANNSADYLQIGTVSGGTPLNGSVAFARAWRRGLSIDEAKLLNAKPWGIFRAAYQDLAALKSSAATGAALGVSAVTSPVVGSMAFKSQPAFALNATTAAIQGAMSFGPASRAAVNATTGDTVGSMVFKSQPVFGVAATTGQTLGAMAFKSQPSLGGNAQTAPAVGSMAFGPSARLSVSAMLAPTVGNMAFVAQPKFAVAAQTAPAVGSMAFKSQPVLAVAANLAPVVGAMSFATRPRLAVAGSTAPAVGSMTFLSGIVADVPGELCLAARPLGTISGNIRKRWNISFEVRPL